MNCPHCNVALLISDRQGIEIDHCPQCRGVWLDRGELDKIIERAARYESRRDDDDDDDDDDRRRHYAPQGHPQHGAPQGYPPPPPQQGYPQYGQPYPYKKKSFWSELFD
jgi:uncharacterized protein